MIDAFLGFIARRMNRKKWRDDQARSVFYLDLAEQLVIGAHGTRQRSRASEDEESMTNESPIPTADDEITIDKWMTAEMKRLSEFISFWRKGSAGGDAHAPADAFPAKMSAGEWDENYRSWGGA